MTDSERLNEVREMARYEGWSDPDPLGRNTVPVALAAFLLGEVERLERDRAQLIRMVEFLQGFRSSSAPPGVHKEGEMRG